MGYTKNIFGVLALLVPLYAYSDGIRYNYTDTNGSAVQDPITATVINPSNALSITAGSPGGVSSGSSYSYQLYPASGPLPAFGSCSSVVNYTPGTCSYYGITQSPSTYWNDAHVYESRVYYTRAIGSGSELRLNAVHADGTTRPVLRFNVPGITFSGSTPVADSTYGIGVVRANGSSINFYSAYGVFADGSCPAGYTFRTVITTGGALDYCTRLDGTVTVSGGQVFTYNGAGTKGAFALVYALAIRGNMNTSTTSLVMSNTQYCEYIGSCSTSGRIDFEINGPDFGHACDVNGITYSTASQCTTNCRTPNTTYNCSQGGNYASQAYCDSMCISVPGGAVSSGSLTGVNGTQATIPMTPGAIPDGDYVLYGRGYNSSALTGYREMYPVNVDTQSTTLSDIGVASTSGTQYQTNGDGVTVADRDGYLYATISGNDNGNSTISAVITNQAGTHSWTGYVPFDSASGQYRLSTSLLTVFPEDGDNYNVALTITDPAGNQSTANYSLALIMPDTEPPVFGDVGVVRLSGGVYPTNGSGLVSADRNGALYLQLVGDDNGSSIVRASVTSLDGASSWTGQLSFDVVDQRYFLTTNSSEAFPTDGTTYNITYEAEDEYGNIATQSYSYELQDLPPGLSEILGRATWDFLFLEYRDLPDGSILVNGMNNAALYSNVTGSIPDGTVFTATTRNLDTGEILGPVELTFRPLNGRIEVQSSDAALLPGDFGTNASYELTFTSTYGTTTQSVSRIVHIDRAPVNYYEINVVAVYDPASPEPDFMGIPGYKTYSEGMVVNTQPTRVLLSLPTESTYPSSLWGAAENLDSASSIQVTRVHEDGENTYFASREITLTSTTPTWYYASISDYANNWPQYGQFYLSGAPGLEMPPRWVSVLGLLSNGANAVGSNASSPNDMTSVRVSLEARNSDQEISLSIGGQSIGFGFVPAGATTADIAISPAYMLTGANYLNISASATVSVNGFPMTRTSSQYGYYDHDVPLIDNFSFDGARRRMVSNATDSVRASLTGAWWNFSIRASAAYLSIDGTSWVQIPRSYWREVSTGHYRTEHNPDALTNRDGHYTLGRVVFTDNYNNRSQMDLPMAVTIDRMGPVIEVLDGANVYNGGQIDNISQLSVRLTDIIGGEQLQSVTITGGELAQPLPVTWRLSNGLYILDEAEIPQSVYAGGYTMTITATDMSNNISTRSIAMNYTDTYIETPGFRGEPVIIPLVLHAFTGSDGFGLVKSAPQAELIGNYPTRVRLSEDANQALVVNGVTVDPGQTVNLPAMDFDAQGHVYAAAVGPTTLGVPVSGNLLFSSAAPNAAGYSVDVTSWTPAFTYSGGDWEVTEVFERYVIGINRGEGVRCRLTSNSDAAMLNNSIHSQICHLVWDSIPDEGSLDTSDPANLSGYAAQIGDQMVRARITMFDGSGEEITLATLERPMHVVPLDVVFAPENINPDGYAIRVQNVLARIVQTSAGIQCPLSTTPQEGPHCLVSWTEIPNSVEQNPRSTLPSLTGSIYDAGPHNVGYTVTLVSRSGVQREIAQGTFQVVGIMPDPPVIDLRVSLRENGGRYVVPIEGGVLGRASITANGGDLVYRISTPNGSSTEYRVTPRSDSPLTYKVHYVTLPANNLWTSGPVTVEAWYSIFPEIRTTRSVDVVWGPSSYLYPRIWLTNVDGTVNDQSEATFMTRIYDKRERSIENPMPIEGAWLGSIIQPIDRSGAYNVVDGPSALDERGYGYFGVQMLGNERNIIRALFHIESPFPDMNFDMMSREYIDVRVLKLSELEGHLTQSTVEGPAPFRLYTSLLLDDRLDTRNLGSVRWEIRTNGGDWMLVENQIGMTLRMSLASGNYEIRAVTVNKYSGAEYQTPILPIHVFDVPRVVVTGPSILMSPQDAELLATVSGQGNNEGAIVEWFNDTGALIGTGTRLALPGLIESMMVKVRARYPDAPASNLLSYGNDDYFVNVEDPRAPSIVIQGPRVLESGQSGTYTAYITPPYRGMTIEPTTRWTLPGGAVVEGESIVWRAPAAGTYRISVTSGYEGFPEGTAQRTATMDVSTWEYNWPQFVSSVHTSYVAAPADITYTIRPTSVVSFEFTSTYRYEWELPQGMTVVSGGSDVDSAVKLRADQGGTYSIGVTVRDNRGNSYHDRRDVTLNPIPAPTITMRGGATRSYAKTVAPVELLASARVSTGHPSATLTGLRWYAQHPGEDWTPIIFDDGLQIHTSARETFETAGSSSLRAVATTSLGRAGSGIYSLDLIPNTAPICSVATIAPYSWDTSIKRITTTCTDADTTIRRYDYYGNGELLYSGISRYLVYDLDPGEVVNLEVRGIDVLGAEGSATAILR